MEEGEKGAWKVPDLVVEKGEEKGGREGGREGEVSLTFFDLSLL